MQEEALLLSQHALGVCQNSSNSLQSSTGQRGSGVKLVARRMEWSLRRVRSSEMRR
jgi:hypothetical protein